MRLPHRAGAVWVLVALALPKLFGAIVTIGLRRYLGPAVSGRFDLAYAPYRFLDNFRNFGTGPAIIYHRRVSRAAANTAWTLNMLAAVAVTLIAQLLARPIAQYYGHPQIEGIFRLLSLGYLIASVTSVHFSLLLRDLDFRARSVPAVGQVVVAGCLAVFFALWGFGVGALVVRELASIATGMILLWLVYPYRPKLQLVPSLARRLVGYSVWVGLGVSALFLSQNVDVFVGGHVIHRARDIGFYTTSWQLAFLAASSFMLISGTVVFPTLSRLQDDHSALTSTLLTAMRQMALAILPVAGLLAAVAPVLIVPLLGAKFGEFRSSFLVLSILAIYAGLRTLLAVFFEGYKSVGKPWIVLVYNLVKLAVMIPVMIVGAQHGILGLAVAYIPIQAAEIPLALLLANRVLQVSPLRVWRALWAPLAATLCMAVAAIGVEVVLLGKAHLDDGPTLVASVAAASVIYPAMLFVLDRHVFAEARMVLFQGL